ncbi:uroporphyrinogen decarboxylase family protein [Hydrogenoanaerobacterium sp.]|uniref:uroporphyrinogen decarboxylase family protein n=1 Tax=Hydrogenoanaerobacterium sp. TaxID=2953763 RepID=UPI0028A217E1|nr:uroporphyrinogen decarboxylase family protein [Hydrogenoanaerobacterium sp.]
MNSRERVIAVLGGQKPDTVPIFPKIAFANTIVCDDMRVIDYMTDPECMAKACITAYRTFGWDGVALHTDIASEGMALGSEYHRPENAPSEIKHYLMETIEDFERVEVPNPRTTEPMRTVIRATELVKQQIGQEAYIIAWTNGPLNVASQVVPLNELLIGLLTDSDTVHQLLQRCTDVSIAYAKELIAAGADGIAYGHATASSTVISRAHYEEFALPYEKQLVGAIQECGAKAITHICGNIEPIVDLISQNGADVIDFDHVCDINQLMTKTSPEKIFRGNLDPTLLAFGTTGEIRQKVKELLEKAGDTGRLLLGSGCEIALNTPQKNLHAFVSAGRDYGKIE